jgi:L,D-transpeptidase YcbB
MAPLRYQHRIRSLLLVLFLIGILIPMGTRAADMPAQNNQKTLPNRVPLAAPSLTPANSFSVPEIQTYTDIQKAILSRLKTGNGSMKSAKGAVPLRERFYSERQFQPAWSHEQAISDEAQKLIQILKESDREGLNPADYRIEQIESLLTQVKQRYDMTNPVTAETWGELDMMLTNAFFVYGTHVSKGRLDPGKWFYQWIPYHRSVDLVQVLTEGLDKKDVEGVLRSLPPRYPAYAQLRTELAHYRRIAADGGWIAIPEKTTLKKGNNSPAVSLLKHRLVISGDLNATALVLNDHFDSHLQAALQKFQERHGLKASGVMDQETRKALNFTVEKRIRQIEWNMERWRWLPDELGPRYIMVNIPDYRLFVVENQTTVMSMKTVVGKPAQPTPVFMDNMTYLELNPTWNLPNSIVAEEMIPKVKKNPDFLTKTHIRIYSNWSSTAREIDPHTIDWAKVNPKKFPYRMIQDAGVNPLGRIKFMFPNQFDVYLHDTTQKGLFQRSKRMYSHGCIRVERPYDLGEWVLRDDPSWSKARLLAEIKQGKRQVVTLPKPIPVYVIYLTAWFDTRGQIHFRDDIYDYDKSLEKVLKMSNAPFPGRDRRQAFVREG